MKLLPINFGSATLFYYSFIVKVQVYTFFFVSLSLMLCFERFFYLCCNKKIQITYAKSEMDKNLFTFRFFFLL